jgi:hypothetical protein
MRTVIHWQNSSSVHRPFFILLEEYVTFCIVFEKSDCLNSVIFTCWRHHQVHLFLESSSPGLSSLPQPEILPEANIHRHAIGACATRAIDPDRHSSSCLPVCRSVSVHWSLLNMPSGKILNTRRKLRYPSKHARTSSVFP